MGYELVDLILMQFGQRHDLHLFKLAKEDEPIRLFDFPKSRWQLRVTLPDENGNLEARICRAGKNETLQSFPASPQTLAETLEKCLTIIKANGGEADFA